MLKLKDIDEREITLCEVGNCDNLPIGWVQPLFEDIDPNTEWGGTWEDITTTAMLHHFLRVGGQPGTIDSTQTILSHRHQFHINIPHSDGPIVHAEYLNTSLVYGDARKRYASLTDYSGSPDNKPKSLDFRLYKKTGHSRGGGGTS